MLKRPLFWIIIVLIIIVIAIFAYKGKKAKTTTAALDNPPALTAPAAAGDNTQPQNQNS